MQWRYWIGLVFGAAFVAGRGETVAEHTEIESTRNRRPELHAALEACRRHKATLLIARLDRLARNVAFISNLTAAIGKAMYKGRCPPYTYQKHLDRRSTV